MIMDLGHYVWRRKEAGGTGDPALQRLWDLLSAISP